MHNDFVESFNGNFRDDCLKDALFSPIIDPRFSYRAEDGVCSLEQTFASIGYTKTIRIDKGA